MTVPTTPEPGDLPPMDAHLLQALRHAPEPVTEPSAAVRQMVLAHARRAVSAAALSPQGPRESWQRRWLGWLRGIRWGQPQWTGAMASVLVAVLAGLLWGNDERREQAVQTAQAPVVQAAPPQVAAAPAQADDVAANTRRPPTQPRSIAPAVSPPAAVAPVPVVNEAAAPVMPAAPAPVTVVEAPARDRVATGARAEMAMPMALSKVAPSPAVLPEALTSLTRSQALLNAAPWTCAALTPAECKPVAAQALLQSPLLRKLLARAQPIGSTVSTAEQQLAWHLQSEPTQAVSTLAWSPSRNELIWSAQGQVFRTILKPDDAAALQALIDATR